MIFLSWASRKDLDVTVLSTIFCAAVMDKTTANYDLIIIDTPAGLEHFSRKTIPDLDDPHRGDG